MSFDLENTSAQRRAREATEKSAAFDRWASEPLVRMSISTIPPGEQKDALQMLLRSAFDAGHGAGAGAMAATFLETILMGERNKRDSQR